MSMHFAPQWVKPIKPSGLASTTPSSTGDVPAPSSAKHTTSSSISSHPFPALNPGRSSSPSTNAHSNPALSYSKITNASSPQSPSFPTENGYFPHAAAGNAFPFRYSREQILALWDEERVKEVPIELADLMEHGAVLVSKDVVRPVGLKDLGEVEKKLLATSVHPINPTRQRQVPGDRQDRERGDREQSNGTPSRRAPGPTLNGKDGAAVGSGRGAFGGFGRGEGGAFGGGKIGSIGSGPPSAGLEPRGPGGLGGGFGGVSKRLSTRRTESSDMGAGELPISARLREDAINTRGSAPWRAARTTSGTFEGVLGFGGGAAQNQSQGQAQGQGGPLNSSTAEIPPIGSSGGWRERQEKERQEVAVSQSQVLSEKGEEKEEVNFGNGGGPGWGSGQKKWRLAAGVDQEKTLSIPIAAPTSESVAATASATPVPERDATVRDISLPQAPTPSAAPIPQPPQPEVQEKEDLGGVEWFYRDPNGQEQGPFAGSQMHEWYSHAYFTDDLPLRRTHETNFHTLAELKSATGNGVQPFLAPVRPKLPPNLPIPNAAISIPPIPSPAANGIPNDAFRNMAIHPGPTQAAFGGGVGGFMPDRNTPGAGPFSPAAFGQFGQHPHQLPLQIQHQHQHQQMQSPGFGSPAAAAPWGGLAGGPPIPQPAFAMRSPFGPGPNDPSLAPQQPYSPAPGAPIYPHSAFSPMPPNPNPNPWGAPGGPGIPHPGPEASFNQQPIQSIQPIQYPSQNQQYAQPPQVESSPVAEQVPTQDNAVSLDEPSYFPPVEATEEAAQISPGADEDVDTVDQVVVESEDVEGTAQAEDVIPDSEISVPSSKAAPVPPTSVWGQVTPTRKQSIAEPVVLPTSATTAKLPPAPASLPSKPVTAISTAPPAETPTAKAVSAAPAVSSPLDKSASTPKSAPWAAKEDKPVVPTGPSLRDIQEAEAKAADARRVALAEARAALAIPSTTTDQEILTNMSWGLPSSGSGKTSSGGAMASPAAAQPPTPAWGSGDAGPKKTLKQIQEEEERRKKATQSIAAAKAAAIAGTPVAVGAATKRGYADLAANAAPAAPAAGWNTVGLGGKVIPGAAPKPAGSISTPTKSFSATTTAGTTTPSKSAISTPTIAAKKPNGTSSSVGGIDEHLPPSVDFLKWTKSALTGLKIPVDDFIQMLLTFPVDPPASSRADVLEIISDSVYANSSTLDGRRFAQEFYEKRKADARRSGTGAGRAAVLTRTVSSAGAGAGPGGGGSLADVVKSLPAKKEDLGFKVVKAKGKKKN